VVHSDPGISHSVTKTPQRADLPTGGSQISGSEFGVTLASMREMVSGMDEISVRQLYRWHMRAAAALEFLGTERGLARTMEDGQDFPDSGESLGGPGSISNEGSDED